MEGLLRMSMKERGQLKELSRVERGGLRLVDAAAILELSHRQCQRVWARCKRPFPKGRCRSYIFVIAPAALYVNELA
jgi:hypothetical protein